MASTSHPVVKNSYCDTLPVKVMTIHRTIKDKTGKREIKIPTVMPVFNETGTPFITLGSPEDIFQRYHKYISNTQTGRKHPSSADRYQAILDAFVVPPIASDEVKMAHAETLKVGKGIYAKAEIIKDPEWLKFYACAITVLLQKPNKRVPRVADVSIDHKELKGVRRLGEALAKLPDHVSEGYISDLAEFICNRKTRQEGSLLRVVGDLANYYALRRDRLGIRVHERFLREACGGSQVPHLCPEYDGMVRELTKVVGVHYDGMAGHKEFDDAAGLLLRQVDLSKSGLDPAIQDCSPLNALTFIMGGNDEVNLQDALYVNAEQALLPLANVAKFVGQADTSRLSPKEFEVLHSVGGWIPGNIALAFGIHQADAPELSQKAVTALTTSSDRPQTIGNIEFSHTVKLAEAPYLLQPKRSFQYR